MRDDIIIRNCRRDDLPALVELINQADKVDGLDLGTTLERQEFEWDFPDYFGETDCFLAWAGDQLVGYADLLFTKGVSGKENVFHCSGVVHPQWRRRGLGRRLLETVYHRAEERLPEVELGPVYFAGHRRLEQEDRKALFEAFGMAPVRTFVNLARPIDDGLPPVEIPGSYRLHTFDPKRDAEAVWQLDNAAFEGHWGFDGEPFEVFLHVLEDPDFRPELWLLAEETASGKAVGIGLNQIEPHWIAQTGRKEGFVATLGVLPEHRKRGLGTALLAQSLHLLRSQGMEAAHLYADAENESGAMRLYERCGFALRRTIVAYRKTMPNGPTAPQEERH